MVDNGQIQRIFQTAVDWNNTQPWSQQTTATDAQGRITSIETINDVGTSTLILNAFNGGSTQSTTLRLDAGQSTQNQNGTITAVIDAAGDKAVVGPDLAVTLLNASGEQIATYNPGQVAWVQGSETGGPGTLALNNTAGSAGTDTQFFSLNPNGTLVLTGSGFDNPSSTSSANLTQLATDAASLKSTINASVGLDTPGSPLTTSVIDSITLVNLGTTPLGQNPFTTDPTGVVAGGAVIQTADVQVIFPNINTDGVFNNSPGNIVSGFWRPAAQDLAPSEQDLVSLTGNVTALFNTPTNGNYGFYTTDIQQQAPSFINTDPLVLDLDGDGITLNNWIANNVYFQTNVVADPAHPGQVVSDGKLHHTSWVGPNDGILVLDRNGNGAINDITETVSEFFQGINYADGFAALADLAQFDALTFSSDTALTDPATGQSYFNEVKVWQDVNQDGISQASELKSLSSLGITSIGLVGSENVGESINGSDVTSRDTFTMGAVTHQIASVNLKTDATGVVAQAASGGNIIQSFGEGDPTPAKTFVAQNASAHAYSVSHGTLTDQTTSQTVGSNLTAVLSSSQGDSITVDPTDTTSYWLGGGSGAGTLNGGPGNTVFLVNAATTVHAGTGFNIAKVVDNRPVKIDLFATKLDEVIGGAGDGVFDGSGANWDVFIQGGEGNNVIIGGGRYSALSGGGGDNFIEAGPHGSVIHAGRGNDVIYGGSGFDVHTPSQRASDIIYAGAGRDTVILGTNNSVVYAGSGNLTVIGNTDPSAFSVVGFHGSYADYTLTPNPDGSITVADRGGNGDGTVTMKDVDALDFKDISQIRLANAAGMPVSDHLRTSNSSQVAINGAGQYVIAAATLLANDLDYSGLALSIRELLDQNGNSIARGASGPVTGGTAALSADGAAITFSPAAGFNGVMSFRYHVKDSSGNNGLGVFQIGTQNTAELTATVYLNTPDKPTDPLFDSESFLQSTNVIPVWKDYTGRGVSIGVFDPSDNVDFSHPDLASNAGQTFKIDGTPGIEQIGAHATLIAGIIGAARDGQGAVGVAYDATLSSRAIPMTFTTTDPIGLQDWRNYDVVNNSFSPHPPFIDDFLATNPNGENPYAQAFEDAVSFGRNGLGTVIVVAGGNDRASGGNTNYFNLTNSHYVITVGGINAQTDLGSLVVSGQPFSNPGATILVSAPASNVNSTGITFSNAYGQTFGADHQTTQGTSFATPIVTGVVALMLEANPNLRYSDVQQILAYSAIRVPTTSHDPFEPTLPNFVYNGAKNWNGGGLHTSQDYGFGEVDALAAVRLAETWPNDPMSNVNIVFSPGNSTFSIPANSSLTYNIDIPSIFGNAQVLHHLDVQLGLVMPDPSQLVMTLISPAGVRSNLLYHPPSTSFDGAFAFGTNRDWGDLAFGNAPGTWHLQVDNFGASTGILQFQQFSFWTSNFSATHIYTNEFGSLGDDPNNASRGILSDNASSGPVTLNAAAITSNSVIDLVPGSTDSMLAGRPLTIASNTTVTTAFGGDGNDRIIGNGANNFLYGERGNDTLIGGAGADTLNGGAGIDTADYSSSSAGVSVSLQTGTGSGGDAQGDVLSGIENIIGSAFNDTLTGDSGANMLAGRAGADTLNGGAGIDTADYSSSSAGVSVSLQSGTGSGGDAQGDVLSGIESTIGSAFNDTLTGDSGANALDGGGGNDRLVGGAGADTLNGGAGNDTADYSSSSAGVSVNLQTGSGSGGDAQSDILSGIENIIGSAFNDTLTGDGGANILAGLAGADTLNGGAGIDAADYSSSSAAVSVSLQTGTGSGGDAQGDVLSGIENIIGSAFNDTLTGDSGANALDGGAGNDTLIGGAGADALSGGAGGDTADYSSSSAGVSVSLQTGTGSGGDAQGDTLNGIENIIGSAFSDMLTGDSGANTLTGGAGNDTLAGGAGADLLIGGPGTDTADYSSSSAAVLVNLQAGADAEGDMLSGIENVIGSAFSDTLTGDSNANALTGGSGNDTLIGGGGADTLNGGRGIDTAVFSGLRSAYTITHIGNTLVVSGPDGSDTLTHIEKLTFADGTVLSGLGPVHSDFNGDSTSDVLWRHDSGTVYFWDMNGLGTIAEGTPAHAPVPNDWHIQGSGDFDVDGNSDVLWRHDSGTVYFWMMDGLQVKTEGGVAHAPVPNDWHIQGVGDFNADGNSDLLWRHDSGTVYFWEMNGLQVIGEGAVAHAAVPNDWQIQGTGDFNGDGNSDILWRHDSGTVYFWEMNGLQVIGEGSVAHAAVPNDWHIQGIGDFNGDGHSDLLWRHDSGQVYFWMMNGLQVIGEGAPAHAPVPNDYHIQGVGDFDDDGKSDILWRHDSGQVYIWEMNGLQIKAEGAGHAPVPNDWHIAA